MRDLYGKLKNPTLKVLAELPDGVNEENWHFTKVRQARGYVNGEYLAYHHCQHCGGWIEGWADSHRVNNLDTYRLAGRSGTSYECRRCGDELDFSGVVS